MKHGMKPLALITALGLLVSACGGGGGSEGNAVGDAPVIPPTKTAIGGYWYGYWNPTGQIGDDIHVEGIVTETGKAFLVEESGAIYSGTLRSSGTSFTGNLVSALLPGVTYIDGGISADAALSGTIEKPDEDHNTQWLNGNFTLKLGDGTQFAGLMEMGYEKDIYEYGSSFEKLAGNYVSQPGPYTYNGAVLNIAANGELFLQDPTSGCVLNGRVTINNKLYNAYDFQVVHSSCTDPALSPLNGVTLNGLAYYYFPSTEFVAYAQGTVAGKLIGYAIWFFPAN
jgi:hypothetical protein